MIDKVPQARARIATAHRRLLEALEARDEDGAQSWMARHIRDFRKGYEIAGIDWVAVSAAEASCATRPGRA